MLPANKPKQPACPEPELASSLPNAQLSPAPCRKASNTKCSKGLGKVPAQSQLFLRLGESPWQGSQHAYLPNLSLLLKSAPLLNSKLRHSTFLQELGRGVRHRGEGSAAEHRLLLVADKTATLLRHTAWMCQSSIQSVISRQHNSHSHGWMLLVQSSSLLSSEITLPGFLPRQSYPALHGALRQPGNYRETFAVALAQLTHWILCYKKNNNKKI